MKSWTVLSLALRGLIVLPEDQEHVADCYEGVSHGTGQYGPESDEHWIKKIKIK